MLFSDFLNKCQYVHKCRMCRGEFKEVCFPTGSTHAKNKNTVSLFAALGRDLASICSAYFSSALPWVKVWVSCLGIWVQHVVCADEDLTFRREGRVGKKTDWDLMVVATSINFDEARARTRGEIHNGLHCVHVSWLQNISRNLLLSVFRLLLNEMVGHIFQTVTERS